MILIAGQHDNDIINWLAIDVLHLLTVIEISRANNDGQQPQPD